MNKQEFQQTIKNMKPPKFFTAITLNDAYKAGFEEAKGNALCNSCFLNEPEKPTVPQFVADWYEKNKDDLEYNLYKLCIDFREQKLCADLHGWFNDDNHKCIETLVKMKLFGYEVEKEKLYIVEIPNPNDFIDNHSRLARNYKGKVVLEVQDWLNTDESYELTEAEIKEDFEWAWQFAKEVKE